VINPRAVAVEGLGFGPLQTAIQGFLALALLALPDEFTLLLLPREMTILGVLDSSAQTVPAPSRVGVIPSDTLSGCAPSWTTPVITLI
jgi:hypothetical protein